MCTDSENDHSCKHPEERTATMKGLAVVSLCVLFVTVVLGRPDDEKYTDQYDSVDVDEILKSERLLANYLSCLKTGKKCTPDGQKLKEVLPDALKTRCSKCTEVQNTQSRKVLRYLIKNKPEDFKDLERMYDPERVYRKDYADELKKEGIVLPD